MPKIRNIIDHFRYQLVCILCLLAVALNGQAIVLDVEYYVGAGPNISYVVIDFNVTGGGYYLFGYCYEDDEVVNSFEMLQAIADEGDLEMSYDIQPFGAFINNFSYQGDVGDVSQFWRFEIGTYENQMLSWSFSGGGVSSRMIYDQSIDGWYNSFTDLTKPGERAVDGLVVSDFVIPSPATFSVSMVVFWVILGRKNGRKVCVCVIIRYEILPQALITPKLIACKPKEY